MRSTPSRRNRSATAITTLAALVSIAGPVAAAVPHAAEPAPRTALSEAQMVRVVTAVVQAVARDLLHGDLTQPLAAAATSLVAEHEASTTAVITSAFLSPRQIDHLLPRLLDLPPPTG